MPKKPKSVPPPDIFDAARAGDLAAVRAHLAAGADVKAQNAQGFTALHCAAMGANSAANQNADAMLRLLLAAGSVVDQLGGGGRTALFLAAEFAGDVGPVQVLLDAGADAKILDQFGNSMVQNAMAPAVQRLLADRLGVDVPVAEVEPVVVKMSASAWRVAKKKLDAVFADLNAHGLVALQDTGTTQEDAFADCSQVWHERGGAAEGLVGYCFYTESDRKRAKATSRLLLGYWAPEGAKQAMQAVGQRIVATFVAHGFAVDWNGSCDARPEVLLG